MKKFLKGKFHSGPRLQAVLSLGIICVLLLVVTAPGLMGWSSALEITSRSIEMSDSNAGTVGATYQVGFTTASTSTIQGIVVDFCANDPLIGDNCTAPTGFTVTTSPTFSNLSGTNPTTGWTASDLNSGRTFVLTNSSGGSISSGASISFDITSVTNPNTINTSFYARILTYATVAGATGYVAGTEGSYVDGGGIALSTGEPITVTAKVEEQLSFCVYNASCGDSPAITLGHGPNTILDSTAVDTNTDDFSVSTNAQHGAVVRMKGDTLTNGSNTIPAVNGGSSTPAAITAGNAAFGMFLSVVGSGMSAASTYAGASGDYGFDTTNLSGTYGDTVASSTGVLNDSVCTLQFGATASNTTPAGVYTANEELVATGTF